jgi:hypothetical protein
MFRAAGATSAVLWGICSTYVDSRSARRVAKARGTCAASVLIDQCLGFDLDGRPHPRHVNVIGWPDAAT